MIAIIMTYNIDVGGTKYLRGVLLLQIAQGSNRLIIL